MLTSTLSAITPLRRCRCNHGSELALAEFRDLRCPGCGSLPAFPLLAYHPPENDRSPGIWRYRRSFPFDADPVSLGEGSTALLPVCSRKLAPAANTVFLKLESGNPSGSFKDRGSTVLAAAARALGRHRLTLASTGNAAASIAGYAARAGLEVAVVVPANLDAGKLRELKLHGAEIRRVDGGFGECEEESRRLTADGYFPAGSDNPLRMEGTKTIAYEILEQLGPEGCDRVLVPIGSGGLLAAVHKGLQEVAATCKLPRLPAVDGVLLSGFLPPSALLGNVAAPPRKDTVASGINIPQPPLAESAAAAVSTTGGTYHFVDDDEILQAQADLARYEGVTAEPTGCVAMAAYRKALARGEIGARERVVVLVTGKLRSNP